MTIKLQNAATEDKNHMANSLENRRQGEAMNIPRGIDKIPASDGIPRYRVRIRIKGHKPVSKNFKDLNLAKKWKRITEGQIEKGLYISVSQADQYTVREAILRYRNEVLSEKTNDEKNIGRYLNRWEKEIGHLELNRLTPSTIAAVRDKMLTENIKESKVRSKSTVTRYLASLSHMLSTATNEWEWIQKNPCHKVKKPKAPSGRVRYLSKKTSA